MVFTVTRNNGQTKDSEFEDYARLLRQQGVDLGKLPRVPEPGTGRRWLHVWDSREKAQAFATELSKRTHNSWIPVEVNAPPSEGPMGPLFIQVGRRSNGLVFGLHPLSRAMIQTAFPASKTYVATVSINFETHSELHATHNINQLTSAVVPTLTGLTAQELKQVGYTLLEEDTERTLVFVQPGELPENGEVPH